MYVFASNGHLECLEFAHENGCPWNEYTCLFAAARKGNLECLKYAYQNYCPINIIKCLDESKQYPNIQEYLKYIKSKIDTI